MKHLLLTITTLFAMVLCANAQQFEKNQGYRLEIGDGLALDCQNGTITFSPVNKKAMTQVWQIHPSARQNHWLLFQRGRSVNLGNKRKKCQSTMEYSEADGWRLHTNLRSWWPKIRLQRYLSTWRTRMAG